MRWTEGDVEANGIRLHYHRTGTGKVPVVCAHGITDNGRCWSGVAQRLADRFDLVLVDARGHGRSEAPEEGYARAVHAADHAGLIRALGLDRPIFIGHSMGAATGIAVAAEYPDCVRALVVEDPPIREPQAARSPARQETARHRTANIEQRKLVSLEDLKATGREKHPEMTEPDLQAWTQSKYEVSPNVGKWTPGPKPDWFELLARIGCPTLLMTGNATHGAIVTRATAGRMLDALQDAQEKNFELAGHCIRYHCFEAFMTGLNEFLTKRGFG